MELRKHDGLSADFSTDQPFGGDTDKPRTNSKSRRALPVVVLSLVLILPAPVMAADGEPPSTTTTISESTTTTNPAGSTTTTTDRDAAPEPSTTTTMAEETTSTPAITSTTSTTPATTTTETGDPLDGENPDETEELPLPSILFPIVGRASYSDTYGAPRDGGSRVHNGTDISAERGSPIVAVADGVVERMGESEDAGLFVVVRHRNGWSSSYVHIKNDSPGTDNGLAVGFGPGIEPGVRVRAGTVLGYVGDSGNAEETSAHLHFELHQPDGFRANPYPALRAARRTNRPSTLPTVDYRQIEAENAEMIAHLDPGGGFNADIAVVEDHAYIGTWGTSDRCPGTGVRVFDVSDVTEPTLTGSFADHTEFPGTATDSLWVGDVDTDFFAGRLAIVGLRDCDNPLVGDDHLVGFALYDLEEPAEARLLGSQPTIGSGVATFDVLVIDGEVTVAAVISTVRPNTNGPQDLVSWFDVTDPSDPKLITTLDVGEAATASQGTREPGLISGRSISWTDPANVVAVLDSGSILEIGVSDLTHPVVVVTPSARPEEDTQPIEDLDGLPSGFFADHRAASYGPRAEVIARLSSGISLIDSFEPSNPTEAATFIPAPAFDPQLWWEAPDGDRRFPMVWDLAESGGYVFASDLHSGLWIVEITAQLTSPLGPNEVD